MRGDVIKTYVRCTRWNSNLMPTYFQTDLPKIRASSLYTQRECPCASSYNLLMWMYLKLNYLSHLGTFFDSIPVDIWVRENTV
jgi:hypothetical protein